MWVFAFLRLKNIHAFPDGYVKSQQPITEPLVFTACKLELCGKVSHVLGVHVRKAMSNKTKRNWGAIAKAWLQGGNLDGHEIFDKGSLD